MNNQYNYPSIVDAHHIGGFKLFIEWSTGEQSIFDASKHLLAPTGVEFRTESLFKQFHVDPHLLYWGDEDFVIMRDDIYECSFPYSAVVTASGSITFLSMARINDMSKFPIEAFAPNIRAYVHGKDSDKHKVPHVHIKVSKDAIGEVPFTFEGIPIQGITPVNPPFSGKVLKKIKEWVLANLPAIQAEWEKENTPK